MVNVIITKFQVGSEAFEAYSNVKADPMTNSLVISQSALLQKTGAKIELKERFDTGVNTGNDAFAGGLIGAGDAATELSLGEQVMNKLIRV